MVKISSKRPNEIWHKQEFVGGKSCQITALLNVNTAIWQVFELVENQTAWWEIGLFWRVFHHRGLLTGHIRHTAVGHHGLHGRLSTDRVSIALAWSHALFIFFDENPVSVSPVNIKRKNGMLSFCFYLYYWLAIIYNSSLFSEKNMYVLHYTRYLLTTIEYVNC